MEQEGTGGVMKVKNNFDEKLILKNYLACTKWTNLRIKFLAIKSVLSKIKVLQNLNGHIRDYVTTFAEPFVKTHLATVEIEIRYRRSKAF